MEFEMESGKVKREFYPMENSVNAAAQIGTLALMERSSRKD
jgi:hypothetical protein